MLSEETDHMSTLGQDRLCQTAAGGKHLFSAIHHQPAATFWSVHVPILEQTCQTDIYIYIC